jgi:hypothetical protein
LAHSDSFKFDGGEMTLSSSSWACFAPAALAYEKLSVGAAAGFAGSLLEVLFSH